MLHIYCGNGKGKTTAAMGLILRAVGFGMKVLLVQFLKDNSSNEIKSLSLLPNVKFLHRVGVEKFTFMMSDEEKKLRKIDYTKLLESAGQICEKQDINLLVLDEVVRACNTGIIEEAKLLEFLKTRPKTLEIVITGTHPSDQLLELADYVSEIVKRKHPYDSGVGAREGIEY